MNEKSVDLLNQAVADELSAVHQYMYFHFHCDDLGYDLLANLFKRTAIDEMNHIELLAERILFLEGDVELKAGSEAKKTQDVAEMLDLAKQMEKDAIKMYNRFAVQSTQNEDSATKKIFEDLVTDEEGHYDVFDVERTNLKKFGDNYLALQSIERSRSGGAPAE